LILLLDLSLEAVDQEVADQFMRQEVQVQEQVL
jgi:hypothetical protein